MGCQLYERIRSKFNPLNEYQSFFGKDMIPCGPSGKINIPHELEIKKKVKAMWMVELDEVDNFRRRMVFIEDNKKNRTIILLCQDKYKPANREPIVRDQTSASVVYGDASAVGSIRYLQEQEGNPFEKANSLAFDEAQKMTKGCEMARTASNQFECEVQLSGAHAVVIEDPKKPGSENNQTVNQAIGFLFGPNGPFKDIIVFPEKGQEKLMEQIKTAGGRTLLKGPDPDPEMAISISQFTKLRESLSESFIKKMVGIYKEERFYLVKALLSQIPYLIHQRKLELANEENFSPSSDDLFKYLKIQLEKTFQQ